MVEFFPKRPQRTVLLAQGQDICGPPRVIAQTLIKGSNFVQMLACRLIGAPIAMFDQILGSRAIEFEGFSG